VLRYLKDPWVAFWMSTFLGFWLFVQCLFMISAEYSGKAKETHFFAFFLFGPMPLLSIWFSPVLNPIYGCLLILRQWILLLLALVVHHVIWIACLWRPDWLQTELKPAITWYQLSMALSYWEGYVLVLAPFLLIHATFGWHIVNGMRKRQCEND
jgi:hypothetical protein